MYDGEAKASAKGGNAVVRTGRSGFGGDADGGPGGGADGGVRGDGWDGECNRKLVKGGGYCSKHNLSDRS